jgi:hypothetical protein
MYSTAKVNRPRNTWHRATNPIQVGQNFGVEKFEAEKL